MGPVRIGNAAFAQRQNDTYGSIVLAVSQMFFDHRLPRRGDAALFADLERLGEQAAALALTPDAGLWEFRGRARVHTHSAAMCWAACRSEEHTSELQSLMRISYAVFCLKKNTNKCESDQL